MTNDASAQHKPLTYETCQKVVDEYTRQFTQQIVAIQEQQNADYKTWYKNVQQKLAKAEENKDSPEYKRLVEEALTVSSERGKDVKAGLLQISQGIEHELEAKGITVEGDTFEGFRLNMCREAVYKRFNEESVRKYDAFIANQPQKSEILPEALKADASPLASPITPMNPTPSLRENAR